MIWCRFQLDGKTSFGIVEGSNVVEVWGNPLDDYAVTNHSYPLDQVKLLAPIAPPMLYAAGPNYRGHVEGMAARRGSPPVVSGPPVAQLSVSPRHHRHGRKHRRSRRLLRRRPAGGPIGGGHRQEGSQCAGQRSPGLRFRLHHRQRHQPAALAASRPHHVPGQELRHLEAHRAVDRHRYGPQGLSHHRPPQRSRCGRISRPPTRSGTPPPGSTNSATTQPCTLVTCSGWVPKGRTVTCSPETPSRWKSAASARSRTMW